MTRLPIWKIVVPTLGLVAAFDAAALAIACADPAAVDRSAGHPSAGAPSAGAPLEKSFSSLCTEADSGDITGTRIKIIGSAPDLTLSYEEPDGAIVATSTTKDVTYTPATGALSFTLTTEAGPLSFHGRASDMGLEGTLKREDGTQDALRLPPDKGGEGEAACGAANETAQPDAGRAEPAPGSEPVKPGREP